MTERHLVEQVAGYLRLQYPEVIVRWDLAADLQLTIGQARRHKLLHPRRGYPDLFIAEARNGYHGCFLELKKEGTRIYLKDGSLSTNPHIREQYAYHHDLAARGYYVNWAVGFDDIVRLLDAYLGSSSSEPSGDASPDKLVVVSGEESSPF